MEDFLAATAFDGEPTRLDQPDHLFLVIDCRPRRHIEVVHIDLIELVLSRGGRKDTVREYRQTSAWTQDRGHLVQRGKRVDPVEGLGEHDKIEIPARRLPCLEGRPFDPCAFRRRYAPHPFVRLDGKDVRAGLRQLRCRNASSGADVQHAHAGRRDETGNQWLWIPRTVLVVLLASYTERLSPTPVGVGRRTVRHSALQPEWPRQFGQG